MVTRFSTFKLKRSSKQYQLYKYAKMKDRVLKKKVTTDTCNVDERKATNKQENPYQKNEIRVLYPPGKNQTNGEKGP